MLALKNLLDQNHRIAIAVMGIFSVLVTVRGTKPDITAFNPRCRRGVSVILSYARHSFIREV